MISSSSLILRPPKVGRWKYFIGICGGVVRSLEREFRAPPWGPRPGPSGEGWLQLGEGAGGAASPHREAEGGRAAAGPARKEKLLPAEATHGPARLRGALCLPGTVGPRPASQGGRPRDTHITSRLQSKWALSGPRGRTRFPLFRLDPIQKCQTQLPGSTGIFGALNSGPHR